MLRAQGITVEFSGLRALEDVSLQVQPGEIVGLIGPNGSGKTTLVNVITGQLRPAAGHVSMGGEMITGLPPRAIALKGVLRSFQTVRLFRNLTVSENVEAAAVAQGISRSMARTRAMVLLCEFGLDDYANFPAGALSYGDERRVEIARALASAPAFLLLDEPAAGMNEAESDTLLELLAQLPSQRGLGLLIIDHDMRLIMRLCHRLHVLASGHTIGEGDIDSVRQLPAVIEAYLGSSTGSGDDRA
jgi:branched-chain amino acid transport system ATP-binding protein